MSLADYRNYIVRRALSKRDDNRAPSSAKPERPVRNDTLGKAQGKEKDAARIHVRITSFRKRLLDPDNLCVKYWVDSLRYNGLIPNDRAEDIVLQVEQVKSKDERTEIVLTTINTKTS